ncbi:hypothetical protein ASF52_19155 [Methylobacterium sp. Leaf112]|nr:hypothetical protein ASF52_19155 [Methylobacterium sp. Leaf112]
MARRMPAPRRAPATAVSTRKMIASRLPGVKSMSSFRTRSSTTARGNEQTVSVMSRRACTAARRRGLMLVRAAKRCQRSRAYRRAFRIAA